MGGSSARGAGPLLAGDEVAVSRWARTWRRRRSQIRWAFLASVPAAGAALTLLGRGDLLAVGAAFGTLSLLFMLSFLAAGARAAVAPMEVFHDGVLGTQFAFPLARRRFVGWLEVRNVRRVERSGVGAFTEVEFGRRARLRSAPDEFGPKDFQALVEAREAAAPDRQEAAAAQRSLQAARLELKSVEAVGVDAAPLQRQLDESQSLITGGEVLKGASLALSVRSQAVSAARVRVEAALAEAESAVQGARAAGRNTDSAESALSRARRLLRAERVEWGAAFEAAAEAARQARPPGSAPP